MLWRCGEAATEDASRPNAHPKAKGTEPEETMIHLKAQSNWCWEMCIEQRLTLFQGERKIDSRWDEVDYKIARQVTNGLSSYEMKDSSGKMKAPHQNRFFLVAIPQGASMALCQNEYANVDPTTHSALVESTPLECDIDLPRNNVEESTVPMLN